MNITTQSDLEQFRFAIRQRDTEQKQYLLKKLLQELDFYIALAVALEPIHRYLEHFEQDYPDETWVRTLVIGIANFGTTPDDQISTEALRQDFSKPGAGNYLKSVSDIVQAMQPSHPGVARIGYLGSAIVNVIMAELVRAWYHTRLVAWERVRANQFDVATGQYLDPEATQIAYQFWTDSLVMQRDADLWTAIAGSLEEKLQR